MRNKRNIRNVRCPTCVTQRYGDRWSRLARDPPSESQLGDGVQIDAVAGVDLDRVLAGELLLGVVGKAHGGIGLAAGGEAVHALVREAHVLQLNRVTELHVDIGRWAAGQVGHLRIGTFASGGPMVAEAMTRFLVKRRDVEVSLDEGEPYELFPRVENGELDVALGFQYDLAPRVWAPQVQLTAILDEELLVVASRRHRLAGKDSVDLTELRHERWVAHRVETAASDCLAAFCGKEGFAPNITFRTNNLGTVRGIVAAGSGVAMISELAHIDRERIIALPITQKRPSRQIVAATRDRYSNPLADAFLDAVRQVSRESVGRA
jgi:DNA-binding transcriptional LysR family regulator